MMVKLYIYFIIEKSIYILSIRNNFLRKFDIQMLNRLIGVKIIRNGHQF